MRAFRLVATRFVKHAMTGEGARLAGGRWNPKGVPVVYTSASLSLAALEMLVNADKDLLPDEMAYFVVDIPDNVSSIHTAIADLPPTWREYPPPDQLQNIGAEWAEQRKHAVMIVASAVIPEENNYLLNPLHPDFARINWGGPHLFSFDARLRR